MPGKSRKLKPVDGDAKKLEAIPSTDPEARDEGPRLIPLRPQKHPPMAGKKFLDLADRALNGPQPKK